MLVWPIPWPIQSPALLGASMKRREFFGLVTGASIWVHGARAQQGSGVRRIGVLSPFSPADTMIWNKALLRGLRDLGWIDGKNLVISYRYAEGNKERLPELVADLIQQKVDILVTTVTQDTLAARKAEIPIVMVAVGDPVATGFVGSLARPGGNITGLSQMTPDLRGKRPELLKEVVPDVSSIAILFNPDDQLSVLDAREARLSAQRLSVEAHSLEVRSVADLERVLGEAVTLRVGGLVILPAPVLF